MRANNQHVEVIMYLGFDEKSEKALETIWKVAQKILEEYGVWVEITPIHVWVHDPMGITIPDLPRIEVNGKVIAIGRVPSEEELREIILTRAYGKESTSQEVYILAAVQRRDPIFEDGVLCQ